MEGRLRAAGGVPPRERLTTTPRPDLPPRLTADGWHGPDGRPGSFGAAVSHATLARPVARVARDLLGMCVVSTIGERATAGVIVETEAYGGPEDPASHAATRSGVTERNRVMFGPAGRAYVYRSYGVHWCLNVVTGQEGRGAAVLLRGLLPLEGIEVMELRRAGRRPLAAGPGRLAQALGVDDALYGHPLDEAPLMLTTGWRVPRARVRISGRVGITTAAERPLRFYVAGVDGVSKPASPSLNDRPA